MFNLFIHKEIVIKYCKKYVLRALDIFGNSIILFVLLALVLWSFSRWSAMLLILCIVVRKVWIIRWVKTPDLLVALRVLLMVFIATRIFTAYTTVLWHEFSRGGAKFHFEDFNFKHRSVMQEYFATNYPVGSDAEKLMYDAISAGAECSKRRDTEEYKRLRSGLDFDYVFSYRCEYQRVFFWNLVFGTIYITQAVTDEKDNIIKIQAYFYTDFL